MLKIRIWIASSYRRAQKLLCFGREDCLYLGGMLGGVSSCICIWRKPLKIDIYLYLYYIYLCLFLN
ncbi:hypothetical protein I7I50_06103 [Histoplasma capsulatum G186AR]|uniref:Uncharacterized protein n=1 Tax=Ajellomyces capsulatus TaxID=5037 RepID=A0A8H7Z0C1_AJECA|nr:hypothetical protein I7I52_08841 [Histoplasma capsulatum]QSS67112.1 hypothetical protein I7I50_06103 [Histoplasma capsulatum G186AR]